MRYKIQHKYKGRTAAIALKPFPEPSIHYPNSSQEALTNLQRLTATMKVADHPAIGIDTEANWDKDDPTSGQLLLLQLGWDSVEGIEALVIHRRHISDEVQTALSTLLGDTAIMKVLQNMRFDREIVGRDLGITIAPPYFDTLLTALVLDNRGKHGLGALTARYLKYELDKSHQTSFAGYTLDTPISEAQVSYGAKDAVALLPLRAELLKSLAIRPHAQALVDLEHHFAAVMLAATPPSLTLARVLTQLQGELDDQLRQLATQWASEQQQVNLLALIDGDSMTSAPPINLNSLKQIQQGLEQVGVSPDSTAPEGLLKVCYQHPSVPVLLRAKWLKGRIASIENASAEGKDPLGFIQLNKFGHMETRGHPFPLQHILRPDDGTQYWVVNVPTIDWWALGALTGMQYGLAQSYQGLVAAHLNGLDALVAGAIMQGSLMYKLGATRLALYVWEATGIAIPETQLQKHIHALKRATSSTLNSWHSQKPTTSLRLPNGRTVYWESQPSYRDWAEVAINCVVSDWLKQSIIALYQQQGITIAGIYHQQVIIDGSAHCPNALKQAIYQSFQIPVPGFQLSNVVIQPVANSSEVMPPSFAP